MTRPKVSEQGNPLCCIKYKQSRLSKSGAGQGDKRREHDGEGGKTLLYLNTSRVLQPIPLLEVDAEKEEMRHDEIRSGRQWLYLVIFAATSIVNNRPTRSTFKFIILIQLGLDLRLYIIHLRIKTPTDSFLLITLFLSSRP